MSVVIPHFNASRTLARALDSVARQSLGVLEVIVVDDASSDLHRAQATRIVAKYPNARVIQLADNSGPAAARNVGWDAAAGTWIAFLDSDDAWHPRKIEIQLSFIRSANPPLALVAARTVQIESLVDFDSVAISPNIEANEITKRSLILKNRMSTPSVIVSRLLTERFTVGRRFAEDYELWMTIAGRGHRVVFVEAPLAAIFKPAYGTSGLSARIWRMIAGEYAAYFGARRAGALTMSDLLLGIVVSTARSGVRLVRIFVRRLARIKK